MARLEVHGVDATRLLTIGPDHSYWRVGPPAAPEGDTWSGTIVRVRPPATATDHEVEALVAALRDLGSAVKVDPRAAAEGVVVEDEDGGKHVDSRSLRQVVTDRLSRARNVLDPERLRHLLDRALDEAGI